MKNENKLVELKSELNLIWNILTMAMQCFEFSSYLYSPSSKREFDYANNSFFINFTRHIYWRNLVIELAKLITDSKSQSYNVFKFLRKLKKNGYFGKLDYENKKIENWEALLQSHQKTIDELLILRNKIYSHTDRDKENYSNSEITFLEVKLLIELLKNILKSIYLDLLDTDAQIEPLSSINENFRVLKILANEEDERKKKITDDFIKIANQSK